MRTLILNAGYEPLGIVSFRRALVLVMNNKATVLEVDIEHPVWTSEAEYARPLVIVLGTYVRLPRVRRVPVSRRGVLRRDDFRCAYCGASANTIDHVIPRSRGGAGSWENLVACCMRCNNLKADRTPREMGWSLNAAPRPPRGPSWTVRGADRAVPSWEPYLESHLAA
ncbi:HNH endonuclease [Mycetocola lacteus]|uniref:HNH endonuclease n=1 Tax=Mycetocola lacteus TaxID=76637 RepID=A0A3L7AT06_9MICO|nr:MULTISPECIES: HNH endonuclease [Mycetocola]MCS4277493.1 5-methylcytosine-specific restriction endonuclease McrA [Mycetocola sp. BIGb0189]RLP83649.1 HNH endonuclease [Mycetocola lacteus]